MALITDTQQHALAQALNAQRVANKLSYEKVARLVYDRLRWAPTAETLRMLHQSGKDPDTVDVVLIAALADVYGCRIRDISPRVASRIEAMESMLRNRWVAVSQAS